MICFAYQGIHLIPELTLLNHVRNPRRWLQDTTHRELIFWCNSTPLGCLELMGVPTTLIGYLEQLALNNPIFPVYSIKVPSVHLVPTSIPGFWGAVIW